MNHMMRFARIAALLVILPCILSAQASKFRYQPAKAESGVVYHYDKTEKDGTNVEHISVFVANPNRLEVFKFHDEPGTRAGLVIATLDYTSFQASRLESWAATGAEEKALVATMEFPNASKAAKITFAGSADEHEFTEIKFTPFHVYNFDLTSLNFMMRHLVDPHAAFQIGIADPNFQEEGPLFLYRGEVTVKYAGDDTRNGSECRKYSIDGPGVQNRGGFVWVRKDGEYFEEVLMDLPDNPNWQSFRFVLRKKEKMSAGDWQKFMKAHFASTK